MGLLEVNSYELHSYGDTGYRGMIAIGSLLSHSCRSVFHHLLILSSQKQTFPSEFTLRTVARFYSFLCQNSQIFFVSLFLNFPRNEASALEVRIRNKKFWLQNKNNWKEPSTNKDDLSYTPFRFSLIRENWYLVFGAKMTLSSYPLWYSLNKADCRLMFRATMTLSLILYDTL